MLNNRINAVVVGSTGYVGLDLVYFLSKHPKVNIVGLCAQKSIGKKINYFDKRIKKNLPKISNIEKIKWNNVDLLFLSLPNGEAQKLIKKLYKNYPKLKFIDLSADFRLNKYKEYKKYYKLNHKAKNLIQKSLYSITELSRNNIKKYRIIANPGCYPTSIQLPLIPLLEKKLIRFDNITIDSKSGYSGAGKNFKKKFKFKNMNLSVYAYATKNHRHISEINQEFKKISNNIQFSFNPHLIPTFRGILSSIYIYKKDKTKLSQIYKALKNYHKKNYFVKIKKLNSPLGTGNVINTNNCEISLCETNNKNKLIIFSAIDNLVKGAAGQAIQNMNQMFNLREYLGLK